MARYLTPTVWRAASGGLDFTTFADSDLAGMIAEAEALVDRFCAFREDQGLGFSAGPRDERHPWEPVRRRVYPDSWPVPVKNTATTPIALFEIVVSQNSSTGANISATVPWQMLVVDNDQGYIEPISLSVIAYGLTPVIAQLSIIQPFAHIQYTAGYAIAKAAYPLASADGLTYHSFLPMWDTATQTPNVYVSGALQASGYTIDATNGAVLFASRPSGPVTVDFTHTLPEGVTQATRATATEIAERFIARRSGLAGLQSLGIAGQLNATRLADIEDVPERAKRLLAPFKRLNI